MKRGFAALLSLLWLPGLAAGQFTDVSFETLRQRARGQDAAAPGAGRLVPVKYQTVYGPGATPPTSLPNLKQGQIVSLVSLMAQISAMNPKEPRPTKNQIQRLFIGMATIDMKFVDPISTQRWDGITKDMGDVAIQEFPNKSRDWDEIVDHMLEKAFADLKETHSGYYNPKEAKSLEEALNGKLTGIGAQVAADPKGLKLTFIYPGSGAEAAGIKADDVVIEVDGKPIAGQSVDQMVKQVKGDAGTTVSLKILRNGAPVGPIRVTRSAINLPNVFSKMASPEVGYVYLSQFSPDADTAVLDAIRELRKKGAKSVILDVRNNPGGSVNVVASIASEFLRDGDDIVSFKHQGMVAMTERTDGDGEFENVPIAVLVNEHSASASEIMAAAMKDKRPGYVVIGSRSYGKGTEQQVMPQPDDRLLKITENRWYSPNDYNIDGRHDPNTGEEIPGTGGVVPNISVPVTPDQEKAIMEGIFMQLSGRNVPAPAPDPVLDKAVEVLSNKSRS